MTVTLTGAGTNFQPGTTVVFSGEGITVSDVNVLSPIQLRATLAIDPGAALGFRDVTASTDLGFGKVETMALETATGIGAFEVVAAPPGPAITGVTPPSGQVGQTLTVLVDGVNTNFDATSVLDMGSGINVLSTTALTPQKLQATIEIDGSAAVGFRSVRVTTGAEVAVLLSGFLVTAAPPLPPLPHGFVLLADKTIDIDKQGDSEGDIHANDRVHFKHGDPSMHTGNVTASKEVKIDKDQIVDGDVTAPKVDVDKDAAVTGTVTETDVLAELLPALAYAAGGDKVKVGKGTTMLLPPGSYDAVTVEDNGTLQLSSGEYLFRKLDVKMNGKISAGILSNNPVTVSVEDDIKFEMGSRVEVTGAPAAPSRFVTFNTMKNVEVKKDAVIQGNIIAPGGKVQIMKGAFFKGAVSAREIDVKEATFVSHGSAVMPPAPVLAPLSDPHVTPVAEANSEVVKTIVLGQNYPNPFNPITTVEFALPEARHVELVVYDVLGRHVATLVDGVLPAGRHQVQWEAGNMPTGMYFYRIVAGDFVKVRQMLLVK